MAVSRVRNVRDRTVEKYDAQFALNGGSSRSASGGRETTSRKTRNGVVGEWPVARRFVVSRMTIEHKKKPRNTTDANRALRLLWYDASAAASVDRTSLRLNSQSGGVRWCRRQRRQRRQRLFHNGYQEQRPIVVGYDVFHYAHRWGSSEAPTVPLCRASKSVALALSINFW